ncbi:MAG: ABC transporter substrate-binding protein [Hungatella sp.]|jgi:sn-glycerol 3-phosphate transport system substrate-binding protein|nr:ABC transporter substrate-binding protein [Hungatella sp.]
MKNAWKRPFSVLMALALCSVLAACGSTPKNSSDSSSSGAGSSAGSEPGAAEKPIEVVFWHSFGGATGEVLQKIIDTYNETRGVEKGIRVSLVYQGYEGTDKVLLAYQTKDTANAPDINVGLTSAIPSMAELDWNVDISEYLDDPATEISADAFPEAMQRACSYEGKMVAVPFANSIPLLYYNADALKEAGFDRAPETLDELAEYTKALTLKDDAGNVTRYGLNVQIRRYQMVQFIVSQSPNSFFGDNEGGRTAPMTKITSGEDGTMKNFLEKWQKVIETGGYKYVEDNINEEFAQGLSAMVIMSSSRLGTIKDLVGDSFDFQAAFLPKVNEGDNGGAAVGGSCLNLFKIGDKARADAAWDVIQYCVQPENQMIFSQASGYIPVNHATYELPEMVKYYEENPQYKVALDEMLAASPNAQEPLDLVYNDVQKVITDTMLEFCEGKRSVDDTVEKITAECNALLDEYHAAN